MFKIAVGGSDDPETIDAIDEAIESCEAQLEGATPTGGLVFVAIEYDLAVAGEAVRRKWPGIQIIGGTTDGEIASPDGFAEDSVSLTLFASDDVKFTAVAGGGSNADPAEAGREAGRLAKEACEDNPVLAITVPEGLGTDITQIVGGLKEVLGAEFPIVGGAAGDQLQFAGTFQLCNDTTTSNTVPLLILSGNLKYSVAVSTGWVPMGRRVPVTKAEGTELIEIDNQPAYEFYRDYLQGQSVFFPLAAWLPDEEQFYLSTPQSFDKEAGTVTLLNSIPEGVEVQLAQATREEILSGARDSIKRAVDDFGDQKPDGALLFSCAGRRASLGTRTNEEFKNLKGLIDDDVPVAGFYSYGEIGPMTYGKATRTHNYTLVTVLLGQ